MCCWFVMLGVWMFWLIVVWCVVCVRSWIVFGLCLVDGSGYCFVLMLRVG